MKTKSKKKEKEPYIVSISVPQSEYVLLLDFPSKKKQLEMIAKLRGSKTIDIDDDGRMFQLETHFVYTVGGRPNR